MGAPDEEIDRMLGRLAREGGTPADSGDLYEELHAVAAKLMRGEREGHTLQATALVHEAYLRLAGSRNLDGADRLRLLDAAAVTMRRVLVDHARRVGTEKRGGVWERVTLHDVELAEDGEQELDLLALQEALTEFEALDPRAAKIVELRFFAGLTGDEIALHLDVSRNTVVRELTHARAWLAQRLGRGGA